MEADLGWFSETVARPATPARPQTGDQLPGEFDQLFLAEYPRVVAIANRVLADPHEAEDVAQEVFISFHRRHAAGSEYAPAWLHRAASHAALNSLRSRQRREKRESAAAPAEADVTEDPQLALEQAESRGRVRAAMRRLPRRSAAILALRYSGLSYAEVAAALRISTDQVGTRLRRAEKRLRTEVSH